MALGTGRLFAFPDPKLQREMDNIYRLLEARITAGHLNIEDVAAAVGRTIRDGQLEVLNRFLSFQYFGRNIKLYLEGGIDQYVLYAARAAVTGANWPVVFFAGNDSIVPVSTMEQLGNGEVLRLKGLNGAYPILFLDDQNGSAVLIDSTVGASLTNAGVWSDAPCFASKKKYFLMPDLDDFAGRIQALEIGGFEFKKKDSEELSGERHFGPTVEDLYAKFPEIKPPDERMGIAGFDLASVALIGVQACLAKIEALEKRVKELEA